MPRPQSSNRSRATSKHKPDPDRSRYLVPKRLAGQALDRVLQELAPDRTRSQLQKLARLGGVERNGGQLRRSHIRIQAGELLDLDFALLDSSSHESASGRLQVVHEDEHLAVVNKPAGLLVHENHREAQRTLSGLAEQQFGNLPRLRGPHRPGIVHRLDRETSGLVIIAKSEQAMADLIRMFAERKLRKSYLALVHSKSSATLPASFSADGALAQVRGKGDLQEVVPEEHGSPSRTEFEVLEQHGSFAWVACSPITGRRHQIRVHLTEHGLPIVGDRLYGSRLDIALPGAPWPARHALHARGLQFQHPIHGASLEVDCPLPADLARLESWLRDNQP